MKASDVQKEQRKLANPKQAELLQRFFKTGPGEYGEGDRFLGLKVPQVRKVAKQCKGLELSEIQKLLDSRVHEDRQAGLFILVRNFEKGEAEARKGIYEFYLKNTKNINNWDLVDLTAPNIVGGWLLDKGAGERKILYKLAKSKSLWERRIAVLATFMFIKYKDYDDALRVADMLVADKHDLIHKGVGWMLREIGNRDQKVEEEWLKRHYKTMPRTMLRYAIEKFDEKKRKFYMGK
ncbi:TPA: DNA alkylation repair protein [Candidatus Woesearchaeota archaeon]|nr:DNA alkylation repair protein [Candidatus Woesearchaeota archaeon]